MWADGESVMNKDGSEATLDNDSMTELTATPWRIVIVDNENSRETEAIIFLSQNLKLSSICS